MERVKREEGGEREMEGKRVGGEREHGAMRIKEEGCVSKGCAAEDQLRHSIGHRQNNIMQIDTTTACCHMSTNAVSHSDCYPSQSP